MTINCKVMLFSKKSKEDGMNAIASFDPSLCEVNEGVTNVFEKDDVAMGCSQGCYSGCIGTCRRFKN